MFGNNSGTLFCQLSPILQKSFIKLMSKAFLYEFLIKYRTKYSSLFFWYSIYTFPWIKQEFPIIGMISEVVFPIRPIKNNFLYPLIEQKNFPTCFLAFEIPCRWGRIWVFLLAMSWIDLDTAIYFDWSFVFLKEICSEPLQNGSIE